MGIFIGPPVGSNVTALLIDRVGLFVGDAIDIAVGI